MRTVLLTNALQYAGPGAAAALLAEGCRLVCHDAAFAEPGPREAFQAAHPGASALRSGAMADIPRLLDGMLPDAVVLNAVHPITPVPVAEIPPAHFRDTFEAVVMAPILLAQALLPAMQARGSGSFVFVTSAREARPEPGFAVPTSMRAAATAFARAMAVEAAPFGIQVNVVAPNYLESELYYPRARFVEDPEGAARIAALVPAGRLGSQAEIGALVAFLASGRSPFTTGQVIRFTGGWA